jgi:hypothetical protein
MKIVFIMSVVFSFSVAAQANGSAIVIPDLSLQQLNDQAARPFEEKFSIVTTNIVETSRGNIEALSKRLYQQPSFAQDVTSAQPLVSKFEKSQVITHHLPAKFAIADLGYGAIYSLDELARQKIIDPRLKNISASRAVTDGFIGEQDVVYLSLRDAQPPASNEFGEVTFIFKDETFELGYFTPFAYSMGLRAFGDAELQADYLAFNTRNVGVYRQFIFAGKSALDDFLIMSFAQNERFKRKLQNKFQKKLRPFLGDTDYIQQHLTECRDVAQMLSRTLGQSAVSDRFDAGSCQELVMFVFGYVNETFADIDSDGRRVRTTNLSGMYGAYRGFPIADSEFSVSRTSPSDFIELKIPTKVDLSLMSAIQIPKLIFNRRTRVFEEFDAEPVIHAIRAYAARTARPFKVIDRETSIEYRF